VVDKRVAFDFSLQFSNGGGLQGQGFRLDIEGDTISDDELAAYIIRDLRLLMVGKVEILNKPTRDAPMAWDAHGSSTILPRVCPCSSCE
jgi:arylformamidase